MTGRPPLRVGIVGAGFMGTTHAEAWAGLGGVEVVGVTAGPDASADALAGWVGARAYTDLDDLVGEVDVLDICAPTDLHGAMVARGAAAGVHVICEKPLGLTPDDVDAAIAACRDAGIQLLVAHVVRFFPEYVTAYERIEAGDVGEPAVLRLRRLTYEPRKRADNWFVDERRSGGLVFDLMIHDLDVARWIAGEVETVHARGIRGTDPAAAFDQASAVLTHRGGAISYVEASWAHPVGSFRTAFDLAGARGVVRFDSDEAAPMHHHPREAATDVGEVPLAAGSPLAESPYRTQLRHFRDVLAGDAEPRVTAGDAAAAVRLADAVARSIRTGAVVRLDAGGAG